MRRYLFDTDSDFATHEIDVAIVGSGLAGLYAAHHLDASLKCTLFTKERMEISSSSLAQGGIAAVTERDDHFTYHYLDTINAGAGLCNRKAVRLIVEEGPKEIIEMLSLGTQFDLDSNGKLKTTREGGHGMNRILHAGGDATGQEMVRTLKETVINKENITLHENAFAADIIAENNKVIGLVVFENGGWHYYKTGCVILSSGGLGQIYRYTTNPTVATGDGFAIALRAGAMMEHMEFIQFHPTGLYTPLNRNRQCFLISEAVRGEGGILLNDAGERFMQQRHPLAELAPRDIVAREIYREIQNQTTPYVKLDITHRSKEFLTARFPTIYKTCVEYGIDITSEPIPVGPVQHYMMGGVKTNLNGETSVKGLLACGEVASTGVHGANRLASNSTLECLVFGRRCAERANSTGYRSKHTPLPSQTQNKNLNIDADAHIIELKGIMVKYCGILRNGRDLKHALDRVSEMYAQLEKAALRTIREMEYANMVIIAMEILKRTYSRKKSVGAHYRTDEGGSADD